MEQTYWTLKDEEGILRPKAGIFTDDIYGKTEAEATARKIGISAVRVKLIEITD